MHLLPQTKVLWMEPKINIILILYFKINDNLLYVPQNMLLDVSCVCQFQHYHQSLSKKPNQYVLLETYGMIFLLNYFPFDMKMEIIEFVERQAGMTL